MTTEERLEHLEHELATTRTDLADTRAGLARSRRRNRWLMAGAAGAAVALAIACTLAENRVTAEPQVGGRVPSVVRAQEFALVDETGESRASLAMVEGAPVLLFWDEKGRTRVMLGVLKDGRHGLIFDDEKGRRRATLGTFPDGSPDLSFSDEKGEDRAVLTVLPDGSPGLIFRDEKGQSRATLSVLPDHDALLMFRDEKGQPIWSAP